MVENALRFQLFMLVRCWIWYVYIYDMVLRIVFACRCIEYALFAQSHQKYFPFRMLGTSANSSRSLIESHCHCTFNLLLLLSSFFSSRRKRKREWEKKSWYNKMSVRIFVCFICFINELSLGKIIYILYTAKKERWIKKRILRELFSLLFSLCHWRIFH